MSMTGVSAGSPTPEANPYGSSTIKTPYVRHLLTIPCPAWLIEMTLFFRIGVCGEYWVVTAFGATGWSKLCLGSSQAAPGGALDGLRIASTGFQSFLDFFLKLLCSVAFCHRQAIC